MISATDLHEQYFGEEVINGFLQEIETLLISAAQKGIKQITYAAKVVHAQKIATELRVNGYSVEPFVTHTSDPTTDMNISYG